MLRKQRSTGQRRCSRPSPRSGRSTSPARQWGESDLKVYQSYLDWLVRAKILKQPMDAKEIATNDLVGDINKDLDLKSVEQALAR